MGIGDWGLGIGPNPQSPIPIFSTYNKRYIRKIYLYILKIIIIFTKLQKYKVEIFFENYFFQLN